MICVGGHQAHESCVEKLGFDDSDYSVVVKHLVDTSDHDAGANLNDR
jgi:hypothetical protein